MKDHGVITCNGCPQSHKVFHEVGANGLNLCYHYHYPTSFLDLDWTMLCSVLRRFQTAIDYRRFDNPIKTPCNIAVAAPYADSTDCAATSSSKAHM